MSQRFFDLVSRVQESGRIQEILKTQQIKYQLQPFKIQGIDCQAIRKTYESIQEKYENPSDTASDPNNWNENERRVFIWFIIFYTYFKDISSAEITLEEWAQFSETFFNKNPKFLHFQLLNMIKPSQKLAWTPEEDDRLVQVVQEEENWRWNEVAKTLFYNSDCTIFKSPKHCRERWLNHLDDKKKRGLWTLQEDLKIFKFVMEYGKRWCKLVPVLKDTRTEHMIKNRYNSLLNKQRKSKKEREEQLCLRIIKQLKKQILNAEGKKQPAVEGEVKDPKVENLTPEEKVNSQNLNTNEKDEKSEVNAVNIKEEDDSQMAVEQNAGEEHQEYPFAQTILTEQQGYYQPQQQYYNFTYVPEVMPYMYQVMQPLTSLYWM